MTNGWDGFRCDSSSLRIDSVLLKYSAYDSDGSSHSLAMRFVLSVPSQHRKKKKKTTKHFQERQRLALTVQYHIYVRQASLADRLRQAASQPRGICLFFSFLQPA